MSGIKPDIKCEVVEKETPEIKYIDELRKANSKIKLLETAMESLNVKLTETECENTKLKKVNKNLFNLLDSKSRENLKFKRVKKKTMKKNGRLETAYQNLQAKTEDLRTKFVSSSMKNQTLLSKLNLDFRVYR